MCFSGGDGLHPCKGGWPAQPQLWALALTQPQQESQQEQQPQSQLLSTPQPRITTLLAPPQPLPFPHLNIHIPASWLATIIYTLSPSIGPTIVLHCSLDSFRLSISPSLLSLIFGLLAFCLFVFLFIFYYLTVILLMTATCS